MTVKFGPGDTKGSDVPGAPSQGEQLPSQPSGQGVQNPVFGTTPDQTNANLQAILNANKTPGQGLTGQARFNALMTNALGTPNSQQRDEWLLQQPTDLSDPEYNTMLVLAKHQAQERQSLRAAFGGNLSGADELAIERGEKPQPKTGLAPNEKAALATANKLTAQAQGTASGSSEVKDIKQATSQYKADIANKRAANEDATRGKAPPGGINHAQIIGLDGQPIQQPGPAPAPGTQAKDLAGSPKAQTPQDIGNQVKQGGYVYVGTTVENLSGDQAQGRTSANTDSYMKTDDAKNAIGGWDPETLAAFQHLMGLPETGLPDPKTYTAWSNVVDTAERLTMNGKKMDPMSVAVAFTKRSGGGSGGGGGGGGGGGAGAAKFKLSDVQSLLTSVMQKEAGRDPTQSELMSFYSYFNGLAGGDTADPTQLATNWVRTNLGSQVGSYGAATTYYQAMLAVLGANAGGGSSG